MANLEVSRAERLDMRIIAMHPTLTRSAAVRLITNGKVLVNDVLANKAGFKLKAGDNIVVDYDENAILNAPDIDLTVLYEDDDCIVIEKPVGILTHSKGIFHPEASVGSWLGRHLANNPDNKLLDLEREVALGSPNNPRAGIVHRLDRATSGILICAKTPEALAWLQKQFADRKVKKTYIAVINGTLEPQEAIIDMPIERNPKIPQMFRVGANGKRAITHYKVIQEGNDKSLVELKPHTGRTHQLRVHMAQQKHPIIGDTFYGGEPADRLYLHAHELEITLLSKETKTFTSILPKGFAEQVA